MRGYNFLCVVLMLLIFSNCGMTQPDGVPEAVQQTFQQKYPGENDPDWHLDKNGLWEANFKIDGIKYRADFSGSGKWIETESSIDEKDLPEAIKRRIEDDYDDYKINEVEMVMHHSKGTFYDVEFKWGGEKVDIEFNTFGERLN